MMKHIHLIGIGGAGLSAIARILVEKGYQVSGSDKLASPLSNELEKIGARVTIGHASENVRGADLVVRSSAVMDDNVEVVAANEMNIPVLKRADFLREFLEPYHVIAVGGTHGKTTTTAMVAWILHQIGQDPSYIIGGVSKDLSGNAHAGSSIYFVIEADEYDRMFLGLHPSQIIITNIEHDHPDCFPTMADYFNAFVEFSRKLDKNGQLILCLDDTQSQSLIRRISSERAILTYGYDEQADYRICNIASDPSGKFSFDLYYGDKSCGDRKRQRINLSIPGAHNILNAAAAITLVDQLDLPLEPAAAALESYSGSGRRFEILAKVNNIVVISDYAHHPTQVKATLQTARDAYPNSRIWTVWQPHTYSRTNLYFKEFSQAFFQADRVIVTDIYAAREPNQPFPYADFVSSMNHPDASHYSSMENIATILGEQLQPGDVLVILSAGDAEQLGKVVPVLLNEKFGGGEK